MLAVPSVAEDYSQNSDFLDYSEYSEKSDYSEYSGNSDYSEYSDSSQYSDSSDPSDSPESTNHRSFWQWFVPSQLVVQNAGNMGLVSAGIGWCYGRNKQWETHLLMGFVPKYKSLSAKPTITVKENFIPWRLRVNDNIVLEPLSCGLYLNTVVGSRFWSYLPSRYPNNYYWFSTRFRINVFMGERLTWHFCTGKKKRPRAITAFYEWSTCDLYLFDYFGNRSVKLRDIIGFSLGVKLQLF